MLDLAIDPASSRADVEEIVEHGYRQPATYPEHEIQAAIERTIRAGELVLRL